MVVFCAPTDVEARLRRDLTEVEVGQVDDLIVEAQALVSGYLGVGDDAYSTGAGVPSAVRVVTSRMCARVLSQSENPTAGAVGVNAVTQTAGPFARTLQYTPGSATGAPWLTSADRVTLKPHKVRGRAFTIDTAPFAPEPDTDD